MTASPSPVRRLLDLIVSLLLYTYFVFGFLLVFVWIYLFFHLFSRDREYRFQQTTHRFYRIFLFLVRVLLPRLRIHIEEDVRSIRSSVIVSNHLSYLDPILLISLFERHKTIVKNTFFHYPFFSWVLKASGYIPSNASGKGSPILMKNLDTMQAFLASGGNLFIFPEGTRSRDGRLGPFNKGAFTIARRCGAPIHVLRIRRSHHLFPPGTLVFHAGEEIVVSVERIGTVPAESLETSRSVSEIIETVRSYYAEEGPGSGFREDRS